MLAYLPDVFFKMSTSLHLKVVPIVLHNYLSFGFTKGILFENFAKSLDQSSLEHLSFIINTSHFTVECAHVEPRASELMCFHEDRHQRSVTEGVKRPRKNHYPPRGKTNTRPADFNSKLNDGISPGQRHNTINDDKIQAPKKECEEPMIRSRAWSERASSSILYYKL